MVRSLGLISALFFAGHGHPALHGRCGAYQVWCDPARSPLIVEISGPKFGALDTLKPRAMADEMSGGIGYLTKDPGSSTWSSFVAPQLKCVFRLDPEVPSDHQIRRRRFVFATALYDRISRYRTKYAFTEYDGPAFLENDFFQFLNGSPDPARVEVMFFDVLHAR